MGLSENSVPLFTQWFCWSLSPKKWLFHWEYTQHFQTNPYKDNLETTAQESDGIRCPMLLLHNGRELLDHLSGSGVVHCPGRARNVPDGAPDGARLQQWQIVIDCHCQCHSEWNSCRHYHCHHCDRCHLYDRCHHCHHCHDNHHWQQLLTRLSAPQKYNPSPLATGLNNCFVLKWC